VLLGLPVDRLLRVLGRELVHRDLLHDHGAPAHRGDDVAVADAARLEQVRDRVRHQLTVHDLAVDDRFRERLRDAPVDQSMLLVRLSLELHHLDAVAADVQAHERLLLAEEHGDHSLGVVPVRIRSRAAPRGALADRERGPRPGCTGRASPDAVVIGHRADFLKRDFRLQ
jgi:hypothetical protein